MSPGSPIPALAVDLVASLAAVGVSMSLRPWRAIGPGGPPWPWLGLWAALPLLWGLDRYTSVPSVLSMSGASMLVLFAGWPLAVLAMVPVGVVIALVAPLDAAEALTRVTWLGVVPATLVLGIGAALRRWLPHHVFVYILGRGFLGTIVAVTLARVAFHALHAGPAGSAAADLVIADLLAAFGEGFLTGMLTAIVVAFRPHWLATYTDRLYLPAAPHE